MEFHFQRSLFLCRNRLPGGEVTLPSALTVFLPSRPRDESSKAQSPLRQIRDFTNMATLADPMTVDPSHHCQELIERLDVLRRNKSFCDVTVEVKGKEFKAHKLILGAASPFFLSLLESDMKESNEQLIRIELEEATACVMEDVLKYIYTGTVSLTEEGCHNLIATADYLLLPGLKSTACGFLEANITPMNCLFNYYFAEKYQCVELKEKSRDMTNSNFSVVMETEDFLNLEIKQVMEWLSSDDIIVNAEEEIFKGIVKWVSHNRRERESNFPELLREVRLLSISHDFLFGELVKEKLVTANNECLNFVLASMKDVFGSFSLECVARPPRKCLETLKDVIFVCGGRKSLCYLPQEDKWYQLPDMVFEHQDHDVIQCRDKIYIFDDQRVGKSHVLEHYTPSTNSWGTVQTTIFPDVEIEDYRENFSSLSVVNGCVYSLGTSSEMIFIYSPDRNDWDILELSQCTCNWNGGCCIVVGCRHLYMIGGSKYSFSSLQDKGSTTVKKFDLNGTYLEEAASMNEARHGAFGTTMNGKIYVAGGLQIKDENCRVLNSCEVYNPSTNEWQLLANLNVPRHSASMVSFKGDLYVIGGLRDRKQSRELSTEVYDSEANKWKKKSAIPVICESKRGKEGKVSLQGLPCNNF